MWQIILTDQFGNRVAAVIAEVQLPVAYQSGVGFRMSRQFGFVQQQQQQQQQLQRSRCLL